MSATARPMVRILDFDPPDGKPQRKITVSIGIPTVDAADNWSCQLEIAGFGETAYTKTFGGADALQALLGALEAAPLLLRLDARGGCLTWLGEEDLGFSTRPEDEPRT